MIDNKDITVTYDSFDDLVAREPKMIKTLENYLKRHPEYEFQGTEVIYTKDNKFKLVLKVQLK